MDPAVVGGDAQRQVGGLVGIAGVDRGHEAAPTQGGQVDGVVGVVVADQGADRAECLDVVDRTRFGVAGPEQGGGQEGSNGRVHVVEGAGIDHHVGRRAQVGDGGPYLVPLPGADQCPHVGVRVRRVPDADLG